jgi:hypothetical protein
MSEATVRFLQAAADVLGNERRLAERLQIGEPLLKAYMEDRLELPSAVFLKTVDIVLEEAQPSEASKTSRGDERGK